MNKQGKLDELDKKIVYYYRNNFPIKEMCSKTGMKYQAILYRINKLRKHGILKRWWEE